MAIITLSIETLAGKKCIRDPNDSSFCTFSGLKDPNEIYDLSSFTDYNAYQIRRVKFVDTFMFHIQKELTVTYSNLEDLDVSNSYVWRLYNIDFASYNNLKKLNVSNNVIGLLRSEFDSNLKRIENLDLSYNKIKRIEIGAFSYKPSLKFLNLSHNIIEELHDDFFRAVKNVQILNLSYNQISIISSDFTNSFTIKELYLNDNQIVSLSSQILYSLNTLDVSNNLLNETIDISGTYLKHLNIHGNSLTKLTINDNLVILDVSDSRERSFEINFGENNAMKELKLSNLDMSNYEKLFHDIAKLNQLENLDISHNNLETFDFAYYLLPKSLKLLNLERTNLRTLENVKNIKNVLPNLREINILDNLLSCKDLPIIKESFKNLNLKMTGLNVSNEAEFIKNNCADDSHHKSTSNDNEIDKIILWTFLIISLIVNVICAVLFIYFKFLFKGSDSQIVMMSNLLSN